MPSTNDTNITAILETLAGLEGDARDVADAVLGVGSAESVLAAARACSRSAALPHVQKEGNT